MTKEIVKKPVDRLTELINKPTVQAQFKNAMGKHSDLFVASLIDVFSSGLTAYDPGLVIQEALKAAVLKLPISKSLGFAYIVPYKGKPQFQIGYKGMIQLTQRTGKVKTLNDGLLYEGETVEHDRLTGSITFGGEKTSEKAIGYFCYLELNDGFSKALFWTKKEVIVHAEKYSKSYNNKKSAWFTNFDSMALKTVWRALLGKYGPMSVEMAGAIADDEIKGSKSMKNITVIDDFKLSSGEQVTNAGYIDNAKKEPTELSEKEKQDIEKQESQSAVDQEEDQEFENIINS